MNPAPDGAAGPMPTWTDSHCHIQSAHDAQEILVRAFEAGILRAVVVGTDAESSRAAVALANLVQEPGLPPIDMSATDLYATVGLHPHDAKDGVDPIRAYLDELASSQGGLAGDRVVAVGECGLDFHYDHSPRVRQRDAFAAQIQMAHQYDLALVIHTREAWDETFAILDAEGVPERCVFHCFSGGPVEADRCLSLGAFLSFSGIVTFTSAGELREAAGTCPLDRMLVETDSPFLTPAPHRGKRNEPAYVALVGSAIARLKGIPESEVAVATSQNAVVVFNLPR